MELVNNNDTRPKTPHEKLSKRVFFSYSPGESSFQQGYLGADKATVSGVLNLRYTDNKPLFAKKIEIFFIGKEYVFFAGTLEEGQDKNEQDDFDSDEEQQFEVDKTKLSTHTAKKRTFCSSLVIWRSQNESQSSQHQELKMLDLPFKFKLPSNLSHSLTIDNGCGRIYYILKAVITRQHSKNRKKTIKILVPIVRYTITPSPSPSRWLEGPANPQIVSYDISLNNTIIGPGSPISVSIKLQFHEQTVYLKKIFVGLKEYHELRTNRYETLTKEYLAKELIDADDLASNDENNKYFVDVKLNIPPSKKLVYSVDSTYLSVKHKLKIKIKLGKAPDICLSKIVTIENIITKDEVYPLSHKVNNPITKLTPPQQDIVKQAPLDSSTHFSVTPQRNSRRLSPFYPLNNKIHTLDPLSQKRITIQLKHSDLTYNSRSLSKFSM